MFAEYKSSPVAGWTDHSNLTDSAVHIANILYVRIGTADDSLKWNVTINITEPAITEAFKLLFSVDGKNVRFEDLRSSKVIMFDPTMTNPNDVYSFSAYNFRGNPKAVHVEVSRNENMIHTSKLSGLSETETAKFVRFSIEKLGGTTPIDTRLSICNLYGGKN